MSGLATVKLGSSIAVEQPAEYGFSVSTGYFTIRRWESTSKESLQAVTAGLLGWDWKITEGVGKHTLEAKLAALDSGNGGGEPETEAPVTTWEVSSSRFEKDFLESNVTPSTPLLTQEEIEDIKTAIEKNDRGLAPTTASGWEAYLMILQGLKSAIVDQSSVLKSQLVSPNYPIPHSFQTNVGKIYTRATLLSSESIPSVYHGAIPMGSTPADSYTGLLVNYPRLRYGFRKNKPQLHGASGGKVQITQVWEEGLWSKFIYGEPI